MMSECFFVVVVVVVVVALCKITLKLNETTYY